MQNLNIKPLPTLTLCPKYCKFTHKPMLQENQSALKVRAGVRTVMIHEHTRVGMGFDCTALVAAH